MHGLGKVFFGQNCPSGLRQEEPLPRLVPPRLNQIPHLLLLLLAPLPLMPVHLPTLPEEPLHPVPQSDPSGMPPIVHPNTPP